MDSESSHGLSYGLLRFRSAPSSVLGGFSESGSNKMGPASEGFEGEKSGPRFMGFSSNNKVFDEKLKEFSGLPPQYPRPSSGLSSSAMEGSYGNVGLMSMDHQSHSQQHKLNSSNLSRQSSSPPGLFSQLSTQNGYAAPGNYRIGSGFNGEISPTNKSKGQFSFPSSLGMLSQISEVGNESLGESGPNDSSRLAIGIGESRFSGSGFHFNNSWSDSSNFSDSFMSSKRDRENEIKLFNGGQNGDLGNRGSLLSHHLSLPRSSSDMSSMERLMQFQGDAVPCKIRAKRGCATHPRSIAERVRRTRISERMRKLQELVPNMDKQTNTADMLDLAVDYIKDLQKQFKALSDNCANCRCSNMPK